MSVVPIDKIPNGLGGGKAKGLAQLKSFGCRISETFVILENNSEAIRDFFADQPKERRYAVRSSANAEDGVDFSFVG